MSIKIVKDIEVWKIGDLVPYDKNPKTHPPEQLEKIKASFKNYGFNNPILVSSEKGIVAGHGRWTAAKDLKMKEVPVIVLDHLDPLKAKAYLLADNKVAESPWDETMLADVMRELEAGEVDMSATGFDDQEISDLLEEMIVEKNPSSGKSSSGTVRVSGKNMVIGINNYLIILTDEGQSNRIKDFCTFMEDNPTMKDRVDAMVTKSLMGVMNEILPS